MFHQFILIMAMLVMAQAYGATEVVTWPELRSVSISKDKSMPQANDQLLKKIKDKVKVVGFMMPLDWEKERVKEFLLLPYYPTCMHVPFPPPNQVVYVKSKKELLVAYAPVTVLGTFKLQKHKEFALFEMDATSVQEMRK